MALSSIFQGKNVLITGGTGSFGKAFASKLLKENLAAKVIIFSRDEWKQWDMRQNNALFNHPNVRFFLGDVRDKERLVRAFNDVHYVIHAAALKQVPAAEYDPSEFVNSNVNGAMNVIDAAIEAGVEKVIALSTDKAVNPVNLYGATKLCSDKLFIAANSYVGKRGYPTFSVVRYGNVLGSRGSLLLRWKELIDQGAKALPITDVRMTRFWITLDQAVEFVCTCLPHALGGEIFIPKAPSVRIVDLAKAFAPKMAHEICGIRPGEKIHEVLLSQDDSRCCYETAFGYVASSPVSGRSYKHYLATEKALGEQFCLASDTNPQFMESQEAIQKLLSHVHFEA